MIDEKELTEIEENIKRDADDDGYSVGNDDVTELITEVRRLQIENSLSRVHDNSLDAITESNERLHTESTRLRDRITELEAENGMLKMGFTPGENGEFTCKAKNPEDKETP